MKIYEKISPWIFLACFVAGVIIQNTNTILVGGILLLHHEINKAKVE